MVGVAGFEPTTTTPPVWRLIRRKPLIFKDNTPIYTNCIQCICCIYKSTAYALDKTLYFGKIFVAVMVVSGCSTVEPKPFDNYAKSGTIKYVIVDSPEELKGVCPDEKWGCAYPQSWGWLVYSVNDWNCITHEFGHAIFGWWHGDEAAACEDQPVN